MSSPSYLTAALRIYHLSLGQMLWSRRTLFMAMIVAAPVLVAGVARGADVTVNDVRVNGAQVFGALIWLLFLRFVVPVLGVLYGTSLIADEVEDKTITYLFTRPVQRGAVLVGKYLSYLTCTTLLVVPSIMAVYLLLTPPAQVPAGFSDLLQNLGTLALGVAVYGALFAFIGAVVRRPLVIGLVFAFGWEPLALLVSGYVRWFTIAFHLQALLPQPTPAGGIGLLQGVNRETPSAATSLVCLMAALVVGLLLAVRAVERREYLLDQ